MTNRNFAGCPDLVIANGVVNSGNELVSNVIEDAESITLFGVAGGDAAKTYKLQISNDLGTTWFDWQDAAAVVYSAPLPGFARAYPNPNASLRAVASAAVLAQTSWKVTKSFYA